MSGLVEHDLLMQVVRERDAALATAAHWKEKAEQLQGRVNEQGRLLDDAAAVLERNRVERLSLEARLAEAERQLASMAQTARIKIPTDTMEQEFQSHYRRGYEAGRRDQEARLAEKTSSNEELRLALMASDDRLAEAERERDALMDIIDKGIVQAPCPTLAQWRAVQAVAQQLVAARPADSAEGGPK